MNFITVRVPSTGKAVILPQISMAGMTRVALKNNPKPEAPKQKMEVGDEYIYVSNPSHEAYPQMINDWEQQVAEYVNDRIWRAVALKQIMDEAKKKEVEFVREVFEDDIDKAEDDRVVWLIHCALPSDTEENKTLLECLMQQKNLFLSGDDLDDSDIYTDQGEPLDGLVEKEIERFQPDV